MTRQQIFSLVIYAWITATGIFFPLAFAFSSDETMRSLVFVVFLLSILGVFVALIIEAIYKVVNGE